MKEQQSYTAKELTVAQLKKIKALEATLIDDKLGATIEDGGYNYEFMIMMNTTTKLLNVTKPLINKNDISNFEEMDITVGDLKD